MSAAEVVHYAKGKRPADYHCKCEYCAEKIGELIQADGSHYSRLERRQYYDPIEKGKGGHIAKTPLHIARWAIQQYSKKGQWVLDPTIGAGTTAVEAITQGRSVAGMELEYGHVVQANVAKAMEGADQKVRAEIVLGDARGIERDLLKKLKVKFDLVVNNPPYSGDVSMPSPAKEGRGKEFRSKETTFKYDTSLPNIAFLREGEEYWDTMRTIYQACIKHLKPGGHFVVGVKDMVRKKEPFLLHKMYCDLLAGMDGMEFVGTAFLRHYPGTLFLNSCEKIHGVKPPFYQTISVFKKG
jgi:DNA modification methylase